MKIFLLYVEGEVLNHSLEKRLTHHDHDNHYDFKKWKEVLVRYKTNRVILVRVDLVISLFLVGIFWQTNASERKTNKISHALLNPNFWQEVLVTTLCIQSTASHSVLWTVRNKIWQEVAFFFIFRNAFIYNYCSRLCTPTHTGHKDWFGCLGVTAATELLNIR